MIRLKQHHNELRQFQSSGKHSKNKAIDVQRYNKWENREMLADFKLSELT